MILVGRAHYTEGTLVHLAEGPDCSLVHGLNYQLPNHNLLGALLRRQYTKLPNNRPDRNGTGSLRNLNHTLLKDVKTIETFEALDERDVASNDHVGWLLVGSIITYNTGVQRSFGSIRYGYRRQYFKTTYHAGPAFSYTKKRPKEH